MHVSLTPELKALVKAKVESGLYSNASEVVRDALRFVEFHEDWIREVKLAQLREQLRSGVEQLDCAESVPVGSRDELDELIRGDLS